MTTSETPEPSNLNLSNQHFGMKPRGQAWWDRYWLDVAKLASVPSRDPSTKCGAVIIAPDKTVVAFGYNGFPRSMRDDEARYANRDEKLSRVIHAEVNAVLSAGRSMKGCTLYTWPFLTCERCAVHMIQAGITRVVAPKSTSERWKESFEKTRSFYKECGVECHEI